MVVRRFWDWVSRMMDKLGLRAKQLASGLGRLGAMLFGVTPHVPEVSAELLAELRMAEIWRQSDAVARELPIRLVVIALIAAVFLVYLPWYLVLGLALVVVLADHHEKRLTASVLRSGILGRDYWAALVAVYVSELAFCLPASVIWHVEDPFTKAISVGVFAAAMMRLATIRSIHPATGFAGAAAMASLISVANSSFWIGVGNWGGLAFTTLIAVVSFGYLGSAIIQNHRQQRLAALSEISAQRASEAKSRFLAQMSHELRTPLNAIIGTGTAVFLTAADARIKEQVAVLLKSAEGLAVVLNDVLDVAAVEEGRITLRPRVGNLTQEVGQTVDLFRPQADAAGLQLRLVVLGQVPGSLRLDYDRLRQCLSNLLSNALKHTSQGQIEVHLRFDPPGQIDIEVRDTGSGVPAGQEERIFDRYERGAATREGYGLGLAICRMLMGQMGGTIGMRPAPVGAVFYMVLPAEVVAEAADSAALRSALQDVAGVRVLVVDDIATNRLVAATYLGLLGCTVVEASGGAAAVERLRAGRDVDVVLLDMNMPGMGGLETLRQLRGLPGDVARLPVIAMTADALDHERQAYLAAGLDGYVTKPIYLNALRAEIATVLARHR